MARKKPNRKNGPARRRKSEGPVEIPDPRMMEAMLRQMMGGMLGGADPSTPLGRAQRVLEQAYDEPSPEKRVELARQALAICPDCADAHVFLAECAASRKEAVAEYEKPVAAAERALGPDVFREAAGHFWGVLETRPYVRARLGLAHALWTSGRQVGSSMMSARDVSTGILAFCLTYGLSGEVAEVAKNLHECHVRHHGHIPMCDALAASDAALMKHVFFQQH